MTSWLEPSQVFFWLLCFENMSPSSWSLLSVGLATGQNYFLWPTFRSPSSSVEVWRRALALSSCFTIQASCALWLHAGASFYLFLNSVGLHWISSWPSEGMTASGGGPSKSPRSRRSGKLPGQQLLPQSWPSVPLERGQCESEVHVEARPLRVQCSHRKRSGISPRLIWKVRARRCFIA